MTTNRQCICCGKEYYFCPVCNSSKRNTGYSMNYDSEECKEVMMHLNGYTMKMCTRERLKEILDTYNITDFSKYKDSIRKQLEEIFPKTDKKEEAIMVSNATLPVEEIKTEVKEIVTEEVTNATNEVKENDTAEVKPRKKRKSRNKKVVLSDETVDHSESD